MYSQNYQNSFTNQAGAAGSMGSQYRGMAAKYQPVGFVQSQYNQPQGNQSISNQYGSSQLMGQYGSNQAMGQYGSNQAMSQYGSNQQFGASQYGSYQSPQSFHTANYRGDQPGHDSQWRSDSSQPAQSQYGTALGASSFGVSAIGSASQSQYNQYASPQSFHTANYRGDQPGHDSQWRSDSSQPAQSQFGIGATGYGNQITASSSFGTGMNQLNQQWSTPGQYAQATSPQAFHTANYRGNQPNHDVYKRADSTQPTQSQYGMSSMNSFQF